MEALDGKPSVQVLQGPVSEDGSKQFYWLLYFSGAEDNVTNVELVSDLNKAVPIAFNQMEQDSDNQD